MVTQVVTHQLCLKTILCWEAGLACQALEMGVSATYSAEVGRELAGRRATSAKVPTHFCWLQHQFPWWWLHSVLEQPCLGQINW